MLYNIKLKYFILTRTALNPTLISLQLFLVFLDCIIYATALQGFILLLSIRFGPASANVAHHYRTRVDQDIVVHYWSRFL